MRKTFFLLLFLCGCATTPSVTIPQDVEKNVVWTEARINGSSGDVLPLVYDLYLPKDVETPPLFLIVHGGNFEGGSHNDKEIVSLASRLTQKGYACMSISYRLKKNNPPAPGIYQGTSLTSAAHAAIVDTKAAYRFARSNADRLGFDSERIFLLGESAGAISCVAAGVSDSSRFNTDDGSPLITNIPVDPKAIISLWGSGTFVLNEFDPSDPPMMVLHGMKDTTPGASFIEALTMVGVCKAKNIPCVFYPIPGKDHGAWDARVGTKDIADLIHLFVSGV